MALASRLVPALARRALPLPPTLALLLARMPRRTATRLRLRLMTGDARGAGIDALATAELEHGGGRLRLLLAPLQGCFTRDSEELFDVVVQEDVVPYADGRPLALVVAPERRSGNGWLVERATLALAPAAACAASVIQGQQTVLAGRQRSVEASDKAGDTTAATAEHAALPTYAAPAATDEQLARIVSEPPAQGEVRLAALCGKWVGSDPDRTPSTPTELRLELSPTGGSPEDAAWLSLTAESAQQQGYSTASAHSEQSQAQAKGTFAQVERGSGFILNDATTQLSEKEVAEAAVAAVHGERWGRGYQRLQVPVTLRHTAVAFPHPDKVRAGIRARCNRTEGLAGEDAYAVHVTPRASLLAVADGVHAWSRVGINSGDASSAVVREARHRFARALETDASSPLPRYLPKPLRLLNLSWDEVRRRDIKGSTTVVLMTLDGRTGVLRSAVLGDSGFVVFRNVRSDHASLLYSSPHQEHSFGRPYQLGHHERSDAPDDAMLHEVRLQPGDVIVCGSDGLFDNLGELDILTMLQQAPRPALMANAIAHAAFDVSMDPSAASPWSRWAEEELDLPYIGGKPDDITVIVAEVVPA